MWEMYDEACPTYQDMLLSIQVGHQFLWDNFRYVPRSALSLGRSGHSLTHPRLLTEAGIESLYILNINPDERARRIKDKELQFIWRPMFDLLGRRTEMFTHIIYDNDISPLDLHVTD